MEDYSSIAYDYASGGAQCAPPYFSVYQQIINPIPLYHQLPLWHKRETLLGRRNIFIRLEAVCMMVAATWKAAEENRSRWSEFHSNFFFLPFCYSRLVQRRWRHHACSLPSSTVIKWIFLCGECFVSQDRSRRKSNGKSNVCGGSSEIQKSSIFILLFIINVGIVKSGRKKIKLNNAK